VSYWLRGKYGGLLVLVIIAGMVGGGLGWVTLAALRLEREQIEARSEADVSSKTRLALWRLDGHILTALATEANRSYDNYAMEVISVAQKKEQTAPLVVIELVPSASTDRPSWMKREFLLARKLDWQSVVKLQETLVKGLGILQPKITRLERKPAGDLIAEELGDNSTLQQLLVPAPRPEALPGIAASENLVPNLPQQDAVNSFLTNNDGTSPAVRQVDPDTKQRIEQAQARGGQAAYANTNRSAVMNPLAATQKQVWALLGPLIPFWIASGEQETLLVSRLVQIGEKRACQVTLVDWPELQSQLAEKVQDLLPAVSLRPVFNGISSFPERAMSALPVELDPGETAVPGDLMHWTPLRIGLLMAWAAALVGLTAVGLGGWSLLNLSERRIRFVSAVTHELRTPLTTLRLYLDMLAGGMVREEKQKEEYIQTLNMEADRLNRLVSNVLDFSRLENQRPRLEKTTIHVSELLIQVQSTWQARCQQAEKELVLENELGPEATMFTDVQLVNQILGNLVDNACKYSRNAEDRRIWVRARNCRPGHILFEVEDRGSGVPAREQRSIFLPFRRGNGESVTVGGVGLGLALAQRWAKLLGGKIGLGCSAAQAGACFQLEVPEALR
jgi:signal transduction histidine kinase